MTTEGLEKKLKISKDTCIHCPTEELAKHVLIFNFTIRFKMVQAERLYNTY